jgi:hypothetical protein
VCYGLWVLATGGFSFVFGALYGELNGCIYFLASAPGLQGPQPQLFARQDTSSDRDCRFDQKEESYMIGRDLFNIPCRICRRPTIHRTRTRHPERKSKSEGHCGLRVKSSRRREARFANPHKHTSTLAHFYPQQWFCIIRVCISSSSSICKQQKKRDYEQQSPLLPRG